MIHRPDNEQLIEKHFEELTKEALGLAGAVNGDLSVDDKMQLDSIKDSLELWLFKHIQRNIETPTFENNIYTRRPKVLQDTLDYVNNTCMMQMTNLSYKNDAVDSIGNQILSIYLPNSTVTDIDKERFHQYMIRLNDELKDSDFQDIHEKLFDSITETVAAINKRFG